jgi:hypothetical protein
MGGGRGSVIGGVASLEEGAGKGNSRGLSMHSPEVLWAAQVELLQLLLQGLNQQPVLVHLHALVLYAGRFRRKHDAMKRGYG